MQSGARTSQGLQKIPACKENTQSASQKCMMKQETDCALTFMLKQHQVVKVVIASLVTFNLRHTKPAPATCVAKSRFWQENIAFDSVALP
jgi:hypothetical protein